MDFSFRNLPDRTVSNLFHRFTFQEIAEFRLVNKWFNSTCSQILNETFLGLENDVESEISALNVLWKNPEETHKIELKYKVLQILKIEISTLYLVCKRYIKSNLYTFSAGKILDYFCKILNEDFDSSNEDNPCKPQAAMKLFLMCEEYGDHFELEIEPKITSEEYSPWYGSKIVDLLDLFLHSNYHITATYHPNSCQISARYEILNPESFSVLKLNKFHSQKESLKLISRYLRNQMRWHNFFFYVDEINEINPNKRKDKQFSKFCLSSNEFAEETSGNNFTKTFSRRLGNPNSNENVSFAVDLQCSRDFMPRRVKACAPDNFNSQNNNRTPASNRIYDFQLTLRLVLPSGEKGSAKENFLELYHNFRDCEVSQKSKRIPI